MNAKNIQKTKHPRTLYSVIQCFILLGYKISYQDGERYIELKKMFSNSDVMVDGAGYLQIGRIIEIYDGKIYSKEYMKRGWLWSGSAYNQEKKNNIYTIGKTRLVAHF